MIRESWVLRLKDKSKEAYMVGEYYLDEKAEGTGFLTQDLNSATIFGDRDREIQELKQHEKIIHEKFGPYAVCNFGYTNIMKNFEFVRVEVQE